jgi:hypothetical protein
MPPLLLLPLRTDNLKLRCEGRVQIMVGGEVMASTNGTRHIREVKSVKSLNEVLGRLQHNKTSVLRRSYQGDGRRHAVAYYGRGHDFGRQLCPSHIRVKSKVEYTTYRLS